MKIVAQGQSIGVTLPVIQVHTVVDGAQVDVEVLEYEIFDAAGTQVNAAQPARDSAVADKIGFGNYVLVWDIPAAEAPGIHTIRWYWKATVADPEVAYSEKFEVLASATAINDPLAPTYTSIARLRAEGITTNMAGDERLLDTIVLASRLAEQYTKRHFEPRSHTYRIDGTGGRILFLDQPIIAIGSVAVETTPDQPSELSIDSTAYRVYNRHLSQGLMSPDDRANPKLEMLHGRDLYGTSSYDTAAALASSFRLTFPKGPQLTRVTGVFGFTDPDGTPYGKTPRLLELAVQRLVMREMYKLADFDGREDARNRWRLIEEKTREQSYKLSDGGSKGGPNAHTSVGAFTGDPEIDNLLVMFMRPIAMGAA